MSLEGLAADQLLDPADLAAMPAFPADRVDFGALIPWKRRLLERAAARFGESAAASLREEFRSWC